MCITQSHSFLAPTVQAGPHLYCCTVDMRRNFSMYYHLWEWELFINIPFYRQYSTMYLCVFFFCVKVSTLTILYICRWYELYVLGFIVCFVHDGLFAHLPLQLPSPQSILWWFYVMMMWTYQMKERVLMQQASFELKCRILMRVFLLYAKGNTRVDLLRWLLGGAISPELLVTSLGWPIVPFPNVLSTRTKWNII